MDPDRFPWPTVGVLPEILDISWQRQTPGRFLVIAELVAAIDNAEQQPEPAMARKMPGPRRPMVSRQFWPEPLVPC